MRRYRQKIILIFLRNIFFSRTIFDWRTPTTYIFAFTFEFIAAAYIILVAIVLLMHAFGSCWILIAFVDDIKTDLSALDAYKRNQISEVKLYEYFCEYIRLYKDIKQLSDWHVILFDLILINQTIIFLIFIF